MRNTERVFTLKLKVVGLIGCIVLGLTTQRTAGGQAEQRIQVPVNTVFKLELLSSISTANNQKGDRFNCLVVEPAEFKDATVEGEITKLKSGGRVGKNSEIALAFRSITMKDGRRGKFDGQVKDVYEVAAASTQGRADEEGRVQGKTVQKRALKIAIGAAVGAAIGVILAGGKGAALGAAIGGGLGAATTISEKSPNMEFTQGTLLDVITPGR